MKLYELNKTYQEILELNLEERCIILKPTLYSSTNTPYLI
ncbi:unnamed protein product [marine sediment metagenome]|uniref:Uncharacterized protein n=1 Tax=marine sediment metagenome TaxID=412755 RepID=X1AUZ1_9ZZZZ